MQDAGSDRLGGECVSEFEDGSNLDSFSEHSLIPSDRANFLSFWSPNIHRLFQRVDCEWLWYPICLGGEKYVTFIALTRYIEWWVNKSLYPGSRGEKVPNLRPVNLSAFLPHRATQDLALQRKFYSVSSNLEFTHLLLHLVQLVCTIYVYWLIHEAIQVQDVEPLSVDTSSNSCCQ